MFHNNPQAWHVPEASTLPGRLVRPPTPVCVLSITVCVFFFTAGPSTKHPGVCVYYYSTFHNAVCVYYWCVCLLLQDLVLAVLGMCKNISRFFAGSLPNCSKLGTYQIPKRRVTLPFCE